MPSPEQETKESIDFILSKRVDLNGDLTRRQISALAHIFFEEFAENDVSNPNFWASVDIKHIQQIRKQAKVPIIFETLWHEVTVKISEGLCFCIYVSIFQKRYYPQHCLWKILKERRHSTTRV